MANKVTLSQAVAASLRDSLLRGEYICGDRLTEITLARDIGVSQNTVRDALRILEQEGWVVKHARRGVFVRMFTEDEAIEVYALLMAVEGVALDWALDTMTKTRLLELRRVINRARRAAHQGETPQAIDALFAFHEALAEAAGKPMTRDLLIRLTNHARLLEALRQARTPRSVEQFEVHLGAHERLLRLMERGDREGARTALMAQIAAYRDVVLPVVKDVTKDNGGRAR